VCSPYFVNFNNNSFQLKALLIFVHLRPAKENRKSHLQLSNLQFCHLDIVILRVAIINNAQNDRLQRRHRPTDDASTRQWRGSQRPLPGVRSMDLVVRNRFRKSSTPRLLHLLFGNSLINRVTSYFFDSQTFCINILSSFDNILNF